MTPPDPRNIHDLGPIPDNPSLGDLARLIEHSHSLLAGRIGRLGDWIDGDGTPHNPGSSTRLDRLERTVEGMKVEGVQREDRALKWYLVIGSAAAAGLVGAIRDLLKA